MNQRLFIPLFVLFAMMFGACGVNINLDVEQGSGNVITETRQVSGFDHVILSGIGDVTVKQGDRDGLQIEAEDNIMPHIKTEVKDNTLYISFDKKGIIPTRTVKFNLTMRQVRGLETQGVSNIQADEIKTDRLDVAISGTGNINLQKITADQLTSNVSGAGSFTVGGEVKSQKISMSGAGSFNGEDLKCASADVTITGIGRVVAWVTGQLNVNISGTGGVDYYGSPQVSQQISGLGQLKHAGDK